MKSEELFARQLCRVLDQGAAELDPSIAERLRAARERALQRQPLAVGAVALAGSGAAELHWDGEETRHPIRTLLSILAVLLGVTLAYFWNAFDQATENEEIDSALLADDLPPNAYLDKGFQAWLEKASRAAE